MDTEQSLIEDFEVIYQEIAKKGPNLKLLEILRKHGLPPPPLKRGKFDKFCDWYENSCDENSCEENDNFKN